MKTGFLMILLMVVFFVGNSVFAEGKTAGESAKDAGQSVSNTAKEVGSDIKKGSEEFGKDVKEGAQQFGRDASAMGKEVGQGFKKARRMLVKGSRRGLKAPENRLFCTRVVV